MRILVVLCKIFIKCQYWCSALKLKHNWIPVPTIHTHCSKNNLIYNKKWSIPTQIHPKSLSDLQSDQLDLPNNSASNKDKSY